MYAIRSYYVPLWRLKRYPEEAIARVENFTLRLTLVGVALLRAARRITSYNVCYTKLLRARARSALRDELLKQQAALTGATLALAAREESTAARLRVWREHCGDYLMRWQQVLGELKAAASVDYGMLPVAVQELRDLVTACQPGTVAERPCAVEEEPAPELEALHERNNFV